MRQYAVFGCGGFGRNVMYCAQQQFEKLETAHELFFVDDYPKQNEVNGQKVREFYEWMSLYCEDRYINVAISDPSIRRNLVTRCLNKGLKFFDVIASNVVQFGDVALGQGAVLFPFVTIGSNTRVGNHFHANIYSYVEHDCVVGDFVTLAPGAKCNGRVIIEDGVYIGSGAIIKQGGGEPIVIGREAKIGMGAVVTKSVLPGVTVVGNPARILSDL